MANMSDSQFKTFRADIRREVRNVSDEIRSNIYGAVVAEARSVAASVARKDGEPLVRNVENLTKLQNRAEHRHENLEKRLEIMGRLLHSQADVIRELESRVKKLEEKPDLSTTISLDPEEVLAGFVTKGSGPLPRPREQVEDGDKLVHNGETFYWWFGRWRRLSELEGFASWIAHRARSK